MEEILRRLVAFPTVGDDPQSNHEALEYIADFVAHRGMHVERFDHHGAESLIATVRPYDKTPRVLLAAHIDVVPATDEQFKLQERDGKYYGRGVLDMKCAAAAYLQFIDDQQDRLQEYDFGLMITTDEEGGGDSVQCLLDEGYRPSVCVLPDGGDDWQIQVYSKGFLYLKLTTSGVPAHGSRPWLGKDAIFPLMQALQDIKALFPNPSPKTSTVNFGSIQAGSVPNQVADHAEALVDIRVASEAERARILTDLNAICKQYNVDLQLLLNGAVGEFSMDDPYIAPFAQAITAVTGIKVDGSRTLGSNDARHFSALNIPCISFYPPGGGHHGPEEWLDKQAFFQMSDILQRYMDEVATTAPRTSQKVKSLRSATPA